MLLGSTLLEVAIGVAFVYLLLSLLCSALSELLESFIKFRARDLKKGIQKLLGDSNFAENLYKHPLVKPLGETPSYIPARTFSLALWNLATTKAGVAGGVTQDLNAIRSLIASLEGEGFANIKTALITLIDEAGGDINKARANIEDWYNDAMDRVSGWYKRRTHRMLVAMGLVAAAFLNVDTINVTKALWYNDALRSSVVTSAQTYLKTTPSPTSTAAEGTAEAEQQADLARKKINVIRAEINQLGLPIGWIFEPVKSDRKYRSDPTLYGKDLAAYNVDPRRFPDSQDVYGWFLKILGVFLTALAVSQGAPFWFDILNKIIVIRSTIKPHEKSQEQPSKDKPAPETIKKKEGGQDQEGDNNS